MSKDLKPYELYLIDKTYNFRNSDIIFTDSVTKKEELLNYVSNDIKEKYPELSFLLNNFQHLYEEYGSTDYGKNVLSAVENALLNEEKELNLLIKSKKQFSFTRNQNITITSDGIEKLLSYPIVAVVKEWFLGLSEMNDRYFKLYIIEKIKKGENK